MNAVSVTEVNKVVSTTVLDVTVPSNPYCFAMIKQDGVVGPASMIKIATSFSIRYPIRIAIVVNITGRSRWPSPCGA